MKKVFYWSPCLSNVGTVSSTLNSAISLSKYSKKNYEAFIINVCGEWDRYADYLKDHNVKLINFRLKYFKFLPKEGFIQSRISYLIIFILSFIPLLQLLKKNKPDFIILHLISSLPLFLLNCFSFKTKFILRISGLPKLTKLRKFLWKLSSSKIFLVTSPTNQLIEQLKFQEIFKSEKLAFLPDAIINMRIFLKKNNLNDITNKNLINDSYFIAAGRLTKQKNFEYLINEFTEFYKQNKNYNLLIFGNGELKKKLISLIKNKGLNNIVHLMGHTENLYYYMKKSEAFILSSLWEEPGFVLVEAAMNNSYIISSNCKNGPSEFLENGKSGTLFESDKKDALKNALVDFHNNKENFKVKKINSKKNCKKYTMFSHYKILINML